MPEPTAKTDRPPLTQALLEIARLHGVAAMRAEGSTTSLTERVTGSKAGSRELWFGRDLPLSVELERALRRYATYWEARMKAEAEGRPRDAQRALTRAILGEVGVDPTAVAFIYGSTTEAVRKARGRAGLDLDTGQRKGALRSELVDGKPTTQVALTAHPGAVIDRLEAQAVEEA